VNTANTDTWGAVDLTDFSEFSKSYPSFEGDSNYFHCCDYLAPLDTVEFLDFAEFSKHYLHLYQEQGSTAPQSIAYSEGTVELNLTENDPLNGCRTLQAEVTLRNVEKYSVLLISFKNENPRFRFNGWTPNVDYPSKTMCAEVIRNGQREIVIGAVGSKSLDGYAINLGRFEVEISSNEDLDLSADDFSLVIADLLEVGGDVRVFRGSTLDRNLTPAVYRNQLSQNYPNPFNPSTTIAFSIAADSHVNLRIYDVTGALVKTLVNEQRRKNNYRVVWDGRNNQGNTVASGVYFYRLVAEQFNATKKMILLR
jgi:hypothetical protein